MAKAKAEGRTIVFTTPGGNVVYVTGVTGDVTFQGEEVKKFPLEVPLCTGGNPDRMTVSEE